MPTDQEKLAIVEEAWSHAGHPTWMRARGMTAERINGEVFVRQTGGSHVFMQFVPSPGQSKFFSLIEAIYAARQKLAAEKEAARTPEERRLAAECERLRKALESISGIDVGAYLHPAGTCIAIARKALEQGGVA